MGAVSTGARRRATHRTRPQRSHWNMRHNDAYLAPPMGIRSGNRIGKWHPGLDLAEIPTPTVENARKRVGASLKWCNAPEPLSRYPRLMSSVGRVVKKTPKSFQDLPPIRVRREPPTIPEAVAAAQDLADDLEQQVEIAAGLIGLPPRRGAPARTRRREAEAREDLRAHPHRRQPEPGAAHRHRRASYPPARRGGTARPSPRRAALTAYQVKVAPV